MKFAMAPSVLVVYVGGKKKAKRLREQLINKQGELIDEC